MGLFPHLSAIYGTVSPSSILEAEKMRKVRITVIDLTTDKDSGS